MKKPIQFIAAQSSVGAEQKGTQDGPGFLLFETNFLTTLSKKFSNFDFLPPISLFCNQQKQLHLFQKQLFEHTKLTMNKGAFPIILGGDHSCSIASIHAFAQKKPNASVFWIDAHLDAHTFDTTPSGNIHGMPISSLLGLANTPFRCDPPAINPNNLCFIGTRSTEPPEPELLSTLGATIIPMHQVANSLQDTFKSLDQFLQNHRGLKAVSLDLDAFDPNVFSSTGCFTPNGLTLEQVHQILRRIGTISHLEIMEFDPHIGQQTQAIYFLDQLFSIFFSENIL